MNRWLILVLCLISWAAKAETAAYTLNPGDVIRISAFNDQRLDRELVVLPDGTISYPVVGEIHAQGMTIDQLQKLITNTLIQKGVLNEGAVVDASVTKTIGYTVYVVGQVKQPGAYTSAANIDVMQAISLAGGLTPFADKSGIKVLRKENGQQTVLKFDYGRIEDGEALDGNFTIHAGDTVIVPN